MDPDPNDYRSFCNALLGLIDEAAMRSYDSDGVAHLKEASEYFQSHCRTVEYAREQIAKRE